MEHTQSLDHTFTQSYSSLLLLLLLLPFQSFSARDAMRSIPLSRSSYRFQHPKPFRSLESLPLLSVTRLRVVQSGSPSSSSFKVPYTFPRNLILEWWWWWWFISFGCKKRYVVRLLYDFHRSCSLLALYWFGKICGTNSLIYAVQCSKTWMQQQHDGT